MMSELTRRAISMMLMTKGGGKRSITAFRHTSMQDKCASYIERTT